ncbi:acyl-CoA dehydrogenase C-terminal domain-containing protein [Seohaeicola sp.]
MIGGIVVGWLWTRMARTALDKLAQGQGDPAFLRAKIASCAYFMKWELPKAMAVAPRLSMMDRSWIDITPGELLA